MPLIDLSTEMVETLRGAVQIATEQKRRLIGEVKGGKLQVTPENASRIVSTLENDLAALAQAEVLLKNLR